MRRRSYLALTAAALPTVTGCTSSPAATTETTTSTTTTHETATTRTSTTTTTTQADVSLEVTDLLVQPGIVLLQTDYLTVHESGGQYLLVDVTVTGGEAPHGDVTLELDGETYYPVEKRRSRRLWRVYDRGEYESTTGGLLVFDLPDGAASATGEAALTCRDWEHDLPNASRTRLAQGRTSFDVEATAPETVTVGDSPSVTLTVENTGEVPGRFLAAINRAGPLVAMRPAELISEPIAAGETRELVHDASDVTGDGVGDDERGDGDPDLTFYLNLLGDSREFQVAYQE